MGAPAKRTKKQYLSLAEGANAWALRSPEELETAMADLAKQADVTELCGWPEEWVRPLRVAARLLAEAAAWKMWKHGEIGR